MEIVSDLTIAEANEVASFLFSNKNTTSLFDITTSRKEKVNTIYRGTKMKIEELKIGGTYKHWNPLSSWSIDKKVAMDFCEEPYIPTTLKHCDVVPVLLLANDQEGFVVNNHLIYGSYSNEKEVIIYSGEWEIVNIEEKMKKGFHYFVVTVRS